MADITEGTVFDLGIEQTIDLTGYGVATGVSFGTTQIDATATADGVASAAVVGTATTDAAVVAVGIDAGSGSASNIQLNAAMQPSGLTSGVAFGDTDTLATVFVIPGPVDPSNDFGNATVTRKGWVFRTPRNTYQWRIPPYKEYEGISVLKEDGVWVEIAHPDLERTLNATYYLAGGRDHVLSTALKDELVAEGYTVTEEVVTTEVFL